MSTFNTLNGTNEKWKMINAYINEFYPNNNGFVVKPYKNHYNIIINVVNSGTILMEIPRLF